MSKLTEIEKEISGYLNVDKSNWTRIYQLMHQVDEEKLYLERKDTPSFTSWVNTLAANLGVHVSLLWARKKAGKVYEEYRLRAQENNRSVPAIDEIRVSPDSLNLCEKVAGKNAAEMDHLIDRVLAGNLSRDDLRIAARAKRAESLDAGGTGGMATSRYDRIEAAERTDTDERITAADIAMALRHPNWLPVKKEEPYFTHVYTMLQEFPLATGSSYHARRIDVMIAETITESERDSVTLRGIEIKVSPHDLENDQKMAEYTEFCDYFYIAIPEDMLMIETAYQVISRTWGIICISKDGRIRIEKEPEKLHPAFRDKALATCIIKMSSEERVLKSI